MQAKVGMNRMGHRTESRAGGIDAAAVLFVFFRVMTASVTGMILVFAGFFTIPRLFGIEPYIVRSSSMEPAIQAGAAAFVDTRQAPETAGQIIAFRAGGSQEEPVTVLHRIAGVTQNGWITKGDANAEADARPVEPQAVVGTYLFSVPRAGFILAGMQGKKILGAAGIVILLNVFTILAEELRLPPEGKTPEEPQLPRKTRQRRAV